MELEESIKRVEQIKESEYRKAEAIETILKELERVQNRYDRVVLQNIEYDRTLEKLKKDTIPKKKIEDKLNEVLDYQRKNRDPLGIENYKIKLLKELLEDK